MGSAGHAFISHTKALSPKANAATGGWRPVPHPLRVRQGQRYWPRRGRSKIVIAVLRVTGAKAMVRQLGREQRTFNVSTERLLELGPEGEGKHYRFAGFTPRRYVTYAVLMGRPDEKTTVLGLPEWHPDRPVPLTASLVPKVGVGSVMRCRADLSAVSPGELAIERLCLMEPDVPLHPVGFEVETSVERSERSLAGEGCGDIVYDLVGGLEAVTRNGDWLEFFCIKRPPRLDPGARVFFAEAGVVDRYVYLESARPIPGGTLLRCKPEVRTLEAGIIAPGGARQSRWRWRWWVC